MAFALRIAGRRASFDLGPDGRWTHSLSPAEAILAGGEKREAYDRAESVLWALNSGLADEGSAVHLNRETGKYLGVLKRHKGGRVFRMGEADPICLPLSLYRSRLAVGVVFAESMAPIDWHLKPAALTRALRACEAAHRESIAHRWYAAKGSFEMASALAWAVCGSDFRSDLWAKAGEDPSWLPLGMIPLLDPLFDHSPLVYMDFDDMAINLLASAGKVVPRMWLPKALEAARTGLSPQQRWLYGCMALAAHTSARGYLTAHPDRLEPFVRLVEEAGGNVAAGFRHRVEQKVKALALLRAAA